MKSGNNYTYFEPASSWISAAVIREGAKNKLTFRQLERLKATKDKKKRQTAKANAGSKKERWQKDGVDYALWCIYTGDDEPSRFEMDPNGWLKDFKKYGMSDTDLKKVEKLFASLGSNYDKSLTSLEKIFKKYISHKYLLNISEGEWYDQADKALFR